MGLGDAFSKAFGGGNDYSAALPPTMGMPKQPWETPQQYQQRIQDTYNATISGYQGDIRQAQGQGSQAISDQNALSKAISDKMGGNIDFSGANATLGKNQGLIDQLLAQGRGEGPNPALDQLRMSTDANVRGSAAMMANARGVNPALAMRSAAMGGANLNQQAAAEAALQAAGQQLGSQQAAGGLMGQQAGLQAQMAGMNADQQRAFMQLLAQHLQGIRTSGLGQQAQSNQAQLGYQSMLNNAYNNMNAINAGTAAQNAATNLQYGMGAMTGISNAIGGMMMAEGGEVPPLPHGDKKVGIVMNEFGKGKLNSSSGKKVTNPKQAIAIALSEQRRAEGHSDGGFVDAIRAKHYADGGEVDPMIMSLYSTLRGQAMSDIESTGAKFQKSMSDLGSKIAPHMPSIPGMGGGGGGGGDGTESLASAGMGDFETGGSMMGGAGALAALASKGGKIEGKAKAKGDAEKNDTVPALLSPGEIVIPRSASKDPELAHAFLDKILKQKRATSYGDVIRAQKELEMWGGGRC